MRRRVMVVMALAGVLALAACTASEGSTGLESDSVQSGTSTGSEAAPLPFDGGDPRSGIGSEASGPAPADAATAEADLVDGRRIVSQGRIAVTVEDPIGAADAAVAIVEGVGGRIDSRVERPADDGIGAGADLVVRIPGSSLTATVDRIGGLGEREQYEVTANDVTAQSTDLDARILALQTSTGRLNTLLATATATEDLIAIETALSERQAELESLQSQQRLLADQVALATVSVAFGSVATAPPDTPMDFLTGIVAGWESLTGFTGAVLVAIGVALPWLILPAVIAGILLLRRRRRVGAPTGR